MPKDKEVLAAINLLLSVKDSQLLRIMKADENNLPYRIADVANILDSAVRELCPPGYEIDR